MTYSMSRALRWLILRFSILSRRRKAARIVAWMTLHDCRTVLLVGALGLEDDARNANIVEHAVSDGRTVIGGLNIYRRTTPYPFVVADARHLPFANQCVDFALANALIEHVGDDVDQLSMVAEHSRVARAWAITTPNRWFPIESHTATLFLHWLPFWRTQQPEFTRLLSFREFKRLLPGGAHIVGHWWSPTFMALYAGGES